MVRALFGASALMSLVSSAVVGMLFLWPRIRAMKQEQALVALIAPHMFLRFVGLPGVVAAGLPAAFAEPVAYGDFVAGCLAITAVIVLMRAPSWAPPVVLVFNIWGAADLLFALYQGVHLQIDPGALGAAFFIPTAIVPPLLVTHALVVLVLVGRVEAEQRGELASWTSESPVQ
jgi:hypothetical protein